MNRRYTTEEFENSVDLLRKYFSDVMITTDIIVGFPGENDEEFAKTEKFLEKIKFYKMHVFKYSPKKGTVAEKMPDQIDGNIKEERSQKLIKLSNKNETEYNKQYIGKVINVLFEEKDEQGYFKGHTANYLIVKVKNEDNLENEILPVMIEKQENMELFGIIEK